MKPLLEVLESWLVGHIKSSAETMLQQVQESFNRLEERVHQLEFQVGRNPDIVEFELTDEQKDSVRDYLISQSDLTGESFEYAVDERVNECLRNNVSIEFNVSRY